MQPDTDRSTPSTTAATAAQAQSREGSWERIPSGRPVRQTVPDQYQLGLGVTRASLIEPYQRESSDPIYRPLKIFTRDPAASLLEGSIASINVPYEKLREGPEGKQTNTRLPSYLASFKISSASTG
jgi:hypothetical protein